MLYAILSGEKIEAVPNTRAKCQLCDDEVLSKCGEIKIWHWAHKADESCDGWYEPETEWHRQWKLIFGKENSEIIIKKNGVKHIADIFTKNDVVIELQNSPIQKPIIRKREEFYGERMLWLINGLHFKENFRIKDVPREKDWMDDYIASSSGWIHKVTGNRLSFPNKPKYNTKKYHNFSWSRARRSWEDTIRHVFIDFGDEDLFWVKSGMGKKDGTGEKINKKKFIEKYEGNLDLLPSVIKKIT